MRFRLNLIQRFVFLNLLWLTFMCLYFGYWFSEELIKTVTRLTKIDLAGALHLDVNKRFFIDDFDDPPQDPAVQQERIRNLDAQVSGLLGKNSEYHVQILWGPTGVVWSNQRERIGQPLAEDALLSDALLGENRAELQRHGSQLEWMWKAIADSDALVNDASAYLRMLIPIRIPRNQLPETTALASKKLVNLIETTEEGEDVIPGVLELHKDPKDILSRTVGTMQSIWKRVLIVTMLTFIALFSLFKSAFNTIERQGRQLREQERLSNLGKMVSYLAHEIRNPLFIIRGSAQTIEETSLDNSPPRKLSRYIIDEVDRLNNMVQDLLGLVKPRLAPSRNPTSLSKAVSDSVERSLKQAPKMELVPQLDPDHDLIWFNRDQLVQVFTNLFRNARDACRGQGTILVESRVSGEGNLQIRITDDGPGIPEENLPKVFEPFFSGKENGTGLGLAIVRHLVTRNNGTIDSVKPAGTGACFILMVRLAPDGAREESDSDSDSDSDKETDPALLDS